MTDQCQDCKADAGIFNLDRDCCLTRLVISAPSRAHRAMQLDFVTRKHGAKRAKIIADLVAEHWQAYRAKALTVAKLRGKS